MSVPFVLAAPAAGRALLPPILRPWQQHAHLLHKLGQANPRASFWQVLRDNQFKFVQ